MTTYKSYITGFILSLAFTLAAYFAVVNHFPNALIIILFLAIAQLVIQLLFFLHVGQEQGPRWNLAVLLSTLGVVLIVVIGSLWIMNHLNYNMTPMEMDQDLMHMENIYK